MRYIPLVLVSLFFYFNIAWLYLYSFGSCENWFSRFISFGKQVAWNTDYAAPMTIFAYLLWPLALVIAILYWVLWRTILYWVLWLIFGGAARTIVGKRLNGKPLESDKEPEPSKPEEGGCEGRNE